MPIELYLNPKAAGYDVLQRDLREELRSIKSVKYTESTVQAPPNTLNLEHDVVKFLIENGPALAAASATVGTLSGSVTLVKGVFELIRSIVDRRKIPTKAEVPPVTIVVNGAALPLPSTPQKETRFLKTLETDGKSSSTKAPRKKSSAKAKARPVVRKKSPSKKR
jgi:hypothetical protein